MKTNDSFFTFNCFLALHALLTLYIYQEEIRKVKNVSLSIFEFLSDADFLSSTIIILNLAKF